MTTPPVTAREASRIAARLRPKYVELLALRELHATGNDPPDLRARLRALASTYPGALRELDRTERSVLRTRLGQLDEVLGGAPLAPWMVATDRVHRWLRVALRRRASFRGRAVGGRLVPVIVALVAAELGLAPSEVADLIAPRGGGGPALG